MIGFPGDTLESVNRKPKLNKECIKMKKTIIAYTSRKNASKVYTLVSSDEANNTATLTDSNGIEHTMKLTTLRKTFKKSIEEIEIEEPKTETKPLTKHQKSALSNVEGAYTYVLGSYENSVQDGHIDEMPSVEDMFEEVYDEAMNSGHKMLGGMRIDGGPAPICVKFAGKKFIREQIAKLFLADGYEVPEELVAVPERKPGHSNFVNGERINLRKDESERLVNVRAFTGMLIGTFKVEEETETSIMVKTSGNKKTLEFDKATGIQLNANNKKYANRMEIL